jgi:hypothetical protein
MPSKSASKAKKPKDRAEYQRFLETAREVGADERPEAFDRAFRKIVPMPKTATRRPAKD